MKFWARLKKSDMIDLYEWRGTARDEEAYENAKTDPKTRSLAKPFEAPNRRVALNTAIGKFSRFKRSW